MKKTLILSLALLLILPVIVRAEDSQPENKQPGRRPEGRILGRPIIKPQEIKNEEAQRTATGTENWQEKTKAYREQIKIERDNRWQNASSTATSTDRRELKQGDKKREQDQKDEQKSNSRGERVKLYADYLLQRLERQIDNVANLISRTKNRAQIMNAAGKDVTAINTKISQADNALSGAKDEIKLLPGQFNTVASSSASSTKPIQNLQATAQIVVDAIKQAHSLIVEAITMINQGQ